MSRANAPAENQTSAQRLMAAALVVFNDVGVDGASIHDICRNAGVSIGSAYHHFGSKQGLADALMTEGLRANAQALAVRLQQATGAQAGVRAVVASLIAWIEDNPDWARFIYLRADAGGRASAGEPLKEVNAEYQQLLGGYFAPHAKAGALRRLPLELYPSFILGPVHDYARRWLSGAAANPPSVHAQAFADAAVALVVANPGSNR